MISIVTPVYNEEENVEFFHDAVTMLAAGEKRHFKSVEISHF